MRPISNTWVMRELQAYHFMACADALLTHRIPLHDLHYLLEFGCTNKSVRSVVFGLARELPFGYH